MWIALALIVAGIVGFWIAAWFAYKRIRVFLSNRRAVEAPYPVPDSQQFAVVLAHGFMGFDNALGKRVHYFRGIQQGLLRQGVKASVGRVGAMESVPARAAALSEFIRDLDEPRVVVLAHSMGGLDARYALCKLGLNERVRALVSVGSPHHGTPLASLGGRLAARNLRKFLLSIGINTEAVDWLGEESGETFNRDVQDAANVFYGSAIGSPRRHNFLDAPMLLASHEVLSRLRGPNDGIVPVSSQAWGEVVATFGAHHFAQVGWSPLFDARAMYLHLLQQLSTRGFPCLPASVSTTSETHAA